MVVWQSECMESETLTAHRRHWLSRYGNYRLTESVSKFGLPIAWYAEYRDEFGGWGLAGGRSYRTKKAAMQALEEHLKRVHAQAQTV